VRREIESRLGHRFFELVKRDPGFNDGHLVDRIDLQDPVHPLHAQDDPAGRGDASSAQPGRSSPGRHGNAGGTGQTEDGRDLVRRLRTDDDSGRLPDIAQGKFVVAISGQGVGVGQNVFRPDDGFQGGPHFESDDGRHGDSSHVEGIIP